MIHETTAHKNSIFTTFTYNDDSLPKDGNVSKETLQLLFKRIRKRLKNRNLKYYACGEYGEKYGRPHYHAALFGMSAMDEDILIKSWHQGNVHIGNLGIESSRYIANYLQKGIYNYQGGRTRPFCLMSKGIGRSWAETNSSMLRMNLGLTLRGNKVKIPKYYLKVLEQTCSEEDFLTLKSDLAKVYDEHIQEVTSHFIDKYQKNSDNYKNSPSHAYEDSLRQSDRNLKARQKQRAEQKRSKL